MARAGNQKVEGFSMVIPAAAAKKINPGDMVGINAGGYAEPATKKTGLTVVGIAQNRMDNGSGSAGELDVLVRTGGYVMDQDGTISRTDISKTCYVSDSKKVTLTETDSSKAGKIIGVDEECVTVLMTITTETTITNNITTGGTE